LWQNRNRQGTASRVRPKDSSPLFHRACSEKKDQAQAELGCVDAVTTRSLPKEEEAFINPGESRHLLFIVYIG
jgi:hypothetical protein